VEIRYTFNKINAAINVQLESFFRNPKGEYEERKISFGLSKQKERV